MAKDDTAIGLGIPYLILVALSWLTIGSRSPTYPPSLWLYHLPGAWLLYVGALLLIPVFILTIIFLATGEDGVEKVAFGLSLPGFLLIISGDIVALYYTIDNFLTPALVLVFVLPQIILAFGLFARRNYNITTFQRSPSIIRRGAPIRNSPRPASRPTPRGSVRITDEVRMASTYRQSIKRCVNCRHTLDSRTRVCYFCGSRQPSQGSQGSQRPQRRPEPRRPPVERPTLYERVHSHAPQQQAKFCPNCGASISTGYLFCTQCGSSLE